VTEVEVLANDGARKPHCDFHPAQAGKWFELLHAAKRIRACADLRQEWTKMPAAKEMRERIEPNCLTPPLIAN
jgi:hypothetical protein